MMRTLLLLAAAANAFTTKQNSLPSARRTASTVAPKMLDAATIQGGAAAFGGLAVGVFSVWFSEQQITRGEERGSDAVSDFTKAKMSAMFMEVAIACLAAASVADAKFFGIPTFFDLPATKDHARKAYTKPHSFKSTPEHSAAVA